MIAIRNRKSRRQLRKPTHKHKLDYWLLFTTLFLTAFGLLMIYDASVVDAFRTFSDKYHFAKLQLVWIGAGLAGMFFLSFLPLKLIKALTVPIFISSLALLVAVLIPGLGQKVQGARRWLSLGVFSLQPSELVKLTFVIYLSSWLEKEQKVWQFALLSAILLGLVMAQPDLGTSIVLMATGAITYFLSGAPIIYFAAAVFSGFIGGLGLIFSSEYRKQRLLTFLNPASDPLGASYHIRQILIALGSGGLLGVGVGRSRQKYAYLPEATTDSIFAVIAEEVGFIGSAIVICLFLFLIYRGFKIAKNAPDNFSKLLASGITAWIGIQTLLNLSAMVALVPLTGIPLPLVSYGGSSTITILLGIGLLLNVSRSHET